MVNVLIKTITGASVTIADVDPSLTVADLKARIEAQLFIPAAEQRIVFNGKVMINQNTLTEAGLVADGQVFLVRSKPAEVPPPAAPVPAPTSTPASASAPATPAHTSLFAPQPGSRGPAAPARAPVGGRAGGGAMMAQLGQLMQSPQGQAMLQQVMSNPDLLRQIMASNPQLASNPEAQAMLSDPSFLAGMSDPDTIQSMLGSSFGGDEGPLISLDLFNIAMDCLNGADVPEGFPNPQAEGGDDEEGGNVSGSSSSTGGRVHREYISMDALDRALDAYMGLTTPTQTPVPVASAPATAPSGSTSASAPPPPQQQAPAAPAPAGAGGPFAAQLSTLSDMGFTNRAMCLQALAAANGDVSMALAFLTEG